MLEQKERGRACVGHGQDAGAGVRELEVLILKLASVDALAACAIASGEVSTCNTAAHLQPSSASGATSPSLSAAAQA